MFENYAFLLLEEAGFAFPQHDVPWFLDYMKMPSSLSSEVT
jgi:hypothetical protein